MIGWVLVGLATAGPRTDVLEASDCDLLSPLDFAMGLEMADSLAVQGNAVGHADVVGILETDIECADFEVDSGRLGQLFWHIALARHPGEGWEGPLTTMVRVAPRTSRPAAAVHGLERWVPVTPPETTPVYEVEGGARVVVDGTSRLKYFELPPDGDHLVQYWTDGEIRTILLPAGDALPGNGPVWRYVSADEQLLRRRRARTVAGGVGGGFLAVGLVGGFIAWQADYQIRNNPATERPRLLQKRRVGGVLAGVGAAGAGASFGVGWGFKW